MSSLMAWASLAGGPKYRPRFSTKGSRARPAIDPPNLPSSRSATMTTASRDVTAGGDCWRMELSQPQRFLGLLLREVEERGDLPGFGSELDRKVDQPFDL